MSVCGIRETSRRSKTGSASSTSRSVTSGRGMDKTARAGVITLLIVALVLSVVERPAAGSPGPHETVRVGIYGRWVSNWPAFVMEAMHKHSSPGIRLVEFRDLGEAVEALKAGAIQALLGVTPDTL